MSCHGTGCHQGRRPDLCDCKKGFRESIRDSLIAPLGYDEPDHGEIDGDDSQRWVLVLIIALMGAIALGALSAIFMP